MKKGINRSDARVRAVWKGPSSALDRSQRMAVKTLQRYGHAVAFSDGSEGFETTALDCDLTDEAAHALETLKHVCNIRARLPRLTERLDDSARSDLWRLMFDCIGLGRHSMMRRAVRRKARMLPSARKNAKRKLLKKGMDTKAAVREKFNHYKRYRTPADEIPAKVANDLGKSEGHIRNLIREMKLK